MPKRHTQRKKFNKVFFLLVLPTLILLGFILIFFFNKATTISPPPLSSSQLLGKLQAHLMLKAEIKPYPYMDWVTQRKVLQPLTGNNFTIGTVNVQDTDKYPQLNPKDLYTITFDNLAPLQKDAEDFFLEQGFDKNDLNTRTTGAEPSQTRFLGFEKAGMRCVVTLYEKSDPFATFFCGKIDRAQIKAQIPFQSLFEYTYQPNAISSFRVERIERDFARGSQIFDYSGYTWIAKKEHRTWKVIWTGEEIPLCSDMQKDGVPQPIYKSCYTP